MTSAYEVVRDRARRALTAAAEPITGAAIAAAIDTTPAQTSKALRQLEARGQAQRQRQQGRQGFRGGRQPDRWTA
jgi:DNA-binding MarR family transcriptional regulator